MKCILSSFKDRVLNMSVSQVHPSRETQGKGTENSLLLSSWENNTSKCTNSWIQKWLLTIRNSRGKTLPEKAQQ